MGKKFQGGSPLKKKGGGTNAPRWSQGEEKEEGVNGWSKIIREGRGKTKRKNVLKKGGKMI